MRYSRLAAVLVASLLSSSFLHSADAPHFETAVLAASNVEHSVNAYPVLEQLPSGRVLCVYATMAEPKSHEMKIVVRSSDDEGKTWSEPITLFQHSGMLDADPNLLLDKDRILAFSTTVPKPGVIERTLIYMRESTDGVHWSDEVQIATPHRYIAGKIHRGWRLNDGTLVMGYAWDTWAEQGMPPKTEGEMVLKSGVLRSSDDGKTWQAGGDLSAETRKTSPNATGGLAEPATVVLTDGRLMTLVRAGGDKLYQAWSSDGGKTWTKPAESVLTAHNTPAALTRTHSGDVIAVWDNSPTNRYPLVTALSHDGGLHWTTPKVITESPGLQASYPSVLQTKSGAIFVAWQQALSDGGREIRLAACQPEWLAEKKTKP